MNRNDPTGLDIFVSGTRSKPWNDDLGRLLRLNLDINRLADTWDAASSGAAKTAPQSGQQDEEACSAGQKAFQWTGKQLMRLGSAGTYVGLGTTAVGGVGAVAGAATGNVPLAGVGVMVAARGAQTTAYSGLVASGGAVMMAVGGAGKPAVVNLGTRLITSRLSGGGLKDFVSEGVSQALGAIVPDIKTCK